VIEEKLEDTMLQEDPLDYMMEVDPMGELTILSSSGTKSPPETMDSLSSKLRFFYPSLFSSLSLWEKEALDNSGWLSCSMIVDTVVLGGCIDSTTSGRVTRTLAQEVGKKLVMDPGFIIGIGSTPSSWPSTIHPLPLNNFNIDPGTPPSSCPSTTSPLPLTNPLALARDSKPTPLNLSLLIHPYFLVLGNGRRRLLT
jgi:hypothetical protein